MPIRRIAVRVLLLSLVLPLAAKAEVNGAARLVRNINHADDPRVSSMPSGFVRLGARVLFFADDREHGRELWSTDGTAEGTQLVVDLIPGSAGLSLQGYGMAELTAVGPSVLFAVREGPFGGSLYLSDGTAAGTRRILDERVFRLTSTGRRVFFTTSSALWVSDGTDAGTRMIITFAQLIGEEDPTRFDSPQSLVPYGDDVVFSTPGESQWGVELWLSDGTATGTRLIRDIQPGTGSGLSRFSDISQIVEWNGLLYFAADDGVSGMELWRSDGTEAGTRQLFELAPGPADCCVYDIEGDIRTYAVVYRDQLFFVGTDGAGRYEMWRTDGQTAERITDLHLKEPRLNLHGDRILIEDDFREYWDTDGTTDGTHRLDDEPPALQAWATPGDRVLVREEDYARQLQTVRDSVTGEVLLQGTLVSPAAVLGQGVVFAYGTTSSGAEPWWSDGTAAGTHRLRDIRRAEAGSQPAWLTDVDGALLFSADDGLHGRELWRSDGTAEGTILVADLNPGETDSDPAGLTAAGKALFFFADDGIHGSEPHWLTADGEVRRIADIGPGASDAHRAYQRGCPGVALPDGEVLFAADDPDGGTALWRTDGSADGTLRITRVSEARECLGFTLAADGLVRFATWGRSEEEQRSWQSDGTAVGTIVVSATASPHLWQLGEQRLLATEHGLYRLASDGSPLAPIEGTEWLDIRWRAVELFDQLFFLGGWPRSLWRTDGTDAGTFQLGAAPSGNLLSVGGRLLLREVDGSALTMLASDGKQSGLIELASFPGEDRGYDPYQYEPLSGPTAAGENLYFTAYTREAGRELWSIPLASVPEVCADGCVPTRAPTLSPTPSPTPTPPIPSEPSTPAVAADAVIRSGTMEAAPGSEIEMAVSLEVRGGLIGGLQVDLAPPAPVTILAGASGRPQCRVTAGFDGLTAQFVFRPDGRGVRALLVSLSESTPLPIGIHSYVCRASISAGASEGRYPLVLRRTIVSDIAGRQIPRTVHDGVLRIAVPLAEQPVTFDCPCDCNGDGAVAVDEMLKAVTVALGAASTSICPIGAESGGSPFDVTYLVGCIDGALNGCGG